LLRHAKGKTNATQGSSAAKGSDANDSGGGVGIGVSFDASWTSPNASGPSDSRIVNSVSITPTATYADQRGKTGEVEGLPGDTAPIQLGLVDDPMAIVGTPSLRAAYAFAGSNPLAYVDPSGQQFTQAQAKAFIKANFKQARAAVAKDPALRASLEQNLKTRLPKSFVRLGLNIDSAELHQKRFEAIDDIAKPFVEINISTGEVKLSPGLFHQFTVRKGAKNTTTTPAATNGSGGKKVTFADNVTVINPKVNAAGPAANSGKGAPAPGRKRSKSAL